MSRSLGMNCSLPDDWIKRQASDFIEELPGISVGLRLGSCYWFSLIKASWLSLKEIICETVPHRSLWCLLVSQVFFLSISTVSSPTLGGCQSRCRLWRRWQRSIADVSACIHKRRRSTSLGQKKEEKKGKKITYVLQYANRAYMFLWCFCTNVSCLWKRRTLVC